MEEETKTNWLSTKKAFWIRFAGWITFAVILPVIFILFRFDIFHKEPRIAIGFWGIVVLAIIFAFLISTVRYVVKAIPFSFVSQCIGGFCKIILPLSLVLIVAIYVRKNLDVFIEALFVVISCEAIAIPVNPMPRWIHDHLSEEQQKRISNVVDLALDKFFSRKKKEGE